MAWTDKQTKAIYERNKNIIVSAGAGSGKTAVLSARILELCKEGTSIDQILVLTFTKAAAAEMKERIAKNLRKAGLEEEANKALNAYITTFDSFSLAMVRKYYYLLGVDPKLTIADQAVLREEKRKIIENIFASYYESDYEPFLNFLRHYSLKNDTEIISMLLSISDKLELIPNEKEYLENFTSNFFKEDNLKKLALEYEECALKEFDSILCDMVDLKGILDEDNEKLSSYLEEALLNASHIKNYEDLLAFLTEFKLPSLKRNTEENIKNLKQSVTDNLKAFKTKFLENYASKEEMILALKKTRDDVNFIVDMCLDISEAIWNYKFKYQAFSFNDIAKMAIKLVSDYENVRNDFYKLKEILVDEYQDTSDLQEAFLSKIEKNNLYMVGDIKQSIYRFRNANPYIFKNKYDQYSLENKGIKIDLLHNFRSRKEVLEDINIVFSSAMTEDYGDANYIKDHQMVFGLQDYEVNKPDYDYHLENITYDMPEESQFESFEIEAFIAAKKVKEIIANNYTFDKETKKIRKAKYSDISIIVDRATQFPVFKKVFTYFKIPLTIDADIDLTESDFSKSILSLLELCVCIKQSKYDSSYKRALVGVLRSFICEYSDEKIYEIIRENRECEVVSIIKNIDLKNSAASILYDLLEKFSIYNKLTLIGNVRNSLLEIEKIQELLVNYNKLGYDFSKSVELVAKIFDDNNAKLKYKVELSKNDEVRIMTIHHSKGLEYPYCIFPLLDVKFNDSDSKARFGFDNEYGIFIPLYENGLKNTILKNLVLNKEKKRNISERIRLFYVALTRAREKIILIHKEKEFKTKELIPSNLSNFAALLANVTKINRNKVKIDIDNLELSKNYLLNKKIENIDTKNEMLRYVENDFRGSILKKEKISKQITSILTKQEKAALEFGTYFHAILESIDLKNPDYSLVKEEFVDKIKSILALPIFDEIENAKIHQEYEFYFEEDNKEYSGIIDLLLEYEDKFVIIDYKLSDISDDAYDRQLSLYAKYVRSVANKKVEAYLLSLYKQEVRKVDV